MKIVSKLLLTFGLAAMAYGPAAAQDTLGDPGVTRESAVVKQADSPPAAIGAENASQTAATATDTVTAEDGYQPLTPVANIGQPQDKEWYLPEQFTPTGQDALWINDVFLVPMMIIISVFVLGLLVFAMFRYRARANPDPSKTAHHTALEVAWTLIPVFVLVLIAVPSIRLIAAQYETAPEDAVTIKATGYQWYWTYTYPDNGGFEIISNMLKEEGEVADGDRFRTDADGPKLLAVDNRMVVPAGVPLRIQTTGADVIHSFAVPSLWFKLDAVPGRLNERQITIEKPGVYYGQCSELCGARHAFMPIAIEALPPARFAAWVRSQGGTMPGEGDAEAATDEPAADAATVEANDNVATAGGRGQ